MTYRADRILALLAGGVLAVVFTTCSAVNVAGWTTGVVEVKSHRDISGPVRELRIAGGGGDVQLMPSRDGNITVDSRVRGSLKTPKLDVDFDGSDVAVRGGCPEVTLGHCEATLLVGVPIGTAVTVDASSGDIAANALNGNLTLHTASGDVRVHNLGGRLDLDTSSGDVDGSLLRSTSVHASTGSGDVDLNFRAVPETVDADTGSGDVTITVPRGPDAYKVDVDTGSGSEDVNVLRDSRSPRLLRADTGSGDVEVVYSGG